MWVALCLDFDLAAQGETFEEARNHLDGMITEYVADALTGPDRDHAASLLNRRAPWRYWLHYYLLGLAQWVRGRTPAGRQSFQKPCRSPWPGERTLSAPDLPRGQAYPARLGVHAPPPARDIA